MSQIIPPPQTGSLWGIIGGMGPLASAEFLRTIYEHADLTYEQNAPQIVLFSDPSFPDRSAVLAASAADNLLARLESRMALLLNAGATSIAVCCLTIHAIFPRLRRPLRDKALSLVDLTVQAVRDSPFMRHLLLCTNGSREANLFVDHPSWPAERIVLPEVHDQRRIHEAIYRLKCRDSPGQFCRLLEQLLAKYRADSFIAGCTEIHLVSKAWKSIGNGYGFVDALDILAAHIAGRRALPVADQCKARIGRLGA